MQMLVCLVFNKAAFFPLVFLSSCHTWQEKTGRRNLGLFLKKENKTRKNE